MNKIAIVSVAVLVSFAVILGSVAQGNTARAAELDAKPFCESQTGKSND
jgi:hypothetical protein